MPSPDAVDALSYAWHREVYPPAVEELHLSITPLLNDYVRDLYAKREALIWSFMTNNEPQPQEPLTIEKVRDMMRQYFPSGRRVTSIGVWGPRYTGVVRFEETEVKEKPVTEPASAPPRRPWYEVPPPMGAENLEAKANKIIADYVVSYRAAMNTPWGITYKEGLVKTVCERIKALGFTEGDALRWFRAALNRPRAKAKPRRS